MLGNNTFIIMCVKSLRETFVGKKHRRTRALTHTVGEYYFNLW